MIECENCKYYDQEQEYCKYLSCDGLDCDDAPCGFPELADYYDYEYGEEENTIIINGKTYQYEMTLSMKVSDEKCCRVFVEGNYYYFG